MTTGHPATREAVERSPKMLYGIEDAIHATGLGRSKLYELMAAGALESVKCGKRRLIPADALEAFVERLRAPGSLRMTVTATNDAVINNEIVTTENVITAMGISDARRLTDKIKARVRTDPEGARP